MTEQRKQRRKVGVDLLRFGRKLRADLEKHGHYVLPPFAAKTVPVRVTRRPKPV